MKRGDYKPSSLKMLHTSIGFKQPYVVCDSCIRCVCVCVRRNCKYIAVHSLNHKLLMSAICRLGIAKQISLKQSQTLTEFSPQRQFHHETTNCAVRNKSPAIQWCQSTACVSHISRPCLNIQPEASSNKNGDARLTNPASDYTRFMLRDRWRDLQSFLHSSTSEYLF